MRAPENKCQISQNDTLYMKFSEFYLCFHNSCEIWHLFSRTSMRNNNRTTTYVWSPPVNNKSTPQSDHIFKLRKHCFWNLSKYYYSVQFSYHLELLRGFWWGFFRSYFNILLFLSTSFITLLECRGLKKSACLGLLCTLHTFFQPRHEN